MANAPALDPRRRNLAILGAAAAALVLLALASLWHQSALTSARREEQTFFPHLASELGHVARIHVASKKGAFDVVFTPERAWVLPGRDNYRASFEQVRATVVGLAALETIEPKTARPEWFAHLDLDAPPKGNGVLIEMFDDKGHSLAALIAGKGEDIGDPGGAMGLYVRKPGSNQSWLVRSVLEPKSDLADWMDKNVVGIDRARIQETDVNPPTGLAYELRRDKPSDADFVVVSMPKARELSDVAAPDGVAAAIVGFSFDDVQPAKNFDFSDSWHITSRTFDGLTVRIEIVQKDKDIWATVAAEGAPGKALADKEAREIDSHASGWAYRLPAYKGQQFMTSLDSLLKPPPAKPAKKK